jgi:hypothetical protein
LNHKITTSLVSLPLFKWRRGQVQLLEWLLPEV